MDSSNTPVSAHGPRALVLPPDLHDAIAQTLAATPPARWIREAQALSERYRGPRTVHERPLATGKLQALGYLALVMPATYAQLRGAMAATAARIPVWTPDTLLDLGSGPGTALWAATVQWPSLRSLVAWEREPAFITVGRSLAQRSGSAAVRGTQWERGDLLQLLSTTSQRYDLVVIGHVLNELSPDVQHKVVAAAWQATTSLMLIVEPGTAAAFAVVRAARDQLLAAGAQTIAPCAHDRPCPLVQEWCHFPQRLVRPDFQRRARGAPSPWEDSKFSYAAMARFAPPTSIWARVIGEATSNKAYAEVLLSTQEHAARYRASKRHREAFRLVKGLRWGEALDEPLPEPVTAAAEA